LSPYFLYAAACCRVETQDIINSLKKVSKTVVPDGIVKYIQISTLTYGKISLVLKNNCYFVETQYQDVLTELLGVIEECQVEMDKGNQNESSLQIFEIN
jgi:DNA excision repair protein ERCC-3